MKSTWTAMNSRLEESEIINKKLISTLINKNVKTRLESFIKYETTMFIADILTMLFWLLPLFRTIMGTYTVVAVEILLLIVLVEQSIKLHKLRKIDIVNNSVIDVTKKAIAYQLFTMRFFRFSLVVLLPLLLITFSLSLYIQNAKPALILTVLFSSVLGFLIGYTIHQNHINNINNLVSSREYINECQIA